MKTKINAPAMLLITMILAVGSLAGTLWAATARGGAGLPPTRPPTAPGTPALIAAGTNAEPLARAALNRTPSAGDAAANPTVAEPGANPPVEADGNFLIGPTYVPAPELAEKPGVPKGRIQQFVMDSADSKFYPGIAKDTLIESADTPFTLHALADGDDAPNRRTPVFLNGAATAEPPLPALPPEATGFAVFRGGERLHVALYAHPACAVAALTGLRRMTWHLRPSRPALSAEAAFAALAPLFSDAPFSIDPPFVRFHTVPGLKGEARLPDGKESAYLRLSINESEYSSVFAK